MIPVPEYDERVRRAINKYRTFVEAAPLPDCQAPTELVPVLTDLVAKNEQSNYLFRGEAKYHPHVSSSLFRKLDLPVDADNFDTLAAYDEQTIRDTTDTHGNTNIARLSRAQHYSGECGRPTNLIDFTESLAVALYFACTNHPSEDGRIIISDSNRFQTNEDLDLSSRETQCIRPTFYDDTRNICQRSHFIYPKTGVLQECTYQTVDIPRQHKSSMLEHLAVNCGIQHNKIFTSGQSSFEGQGYNNISLNLHLLGVTMEWLGNFREAARLYGKLGIHAAHDSRIRLLEWKGESGPYRSNDALVLAKILSGKASTLHNLACGELADGSFSEAERLWEMAWTTVKLAMAVDPRGAQPGLPTLLPEILFGLGRCKLCAVDTKHNDPVRLGEAIALLKLAICQHQLEVGPGADLRGADFSFTLADAERRAGLLSRSACRLEGIIRNCNEHPGIVQFEELLAKVEQCLENSKLSGTPQGPRQPPRSL